MATGYQIDQDLEKGDLRMTMGGEPTFVSIDDMESAQWNTAADGVEKRIIAHDLIFRLRSRFGPDGMIHFGQGKWYPGEPPAPLAVWPVLEKGSLSYLEKYSFDRPRKNGEKI